MYIYYKCEKDDESINRKFRAIRYNMFGNKVITEFTLKGIL